MKLDLGHEVWRLVINTPKEGRESGFQEIELEVGTVNIPDRVGAEVLTSLTARQHEDSRFVGRIGIHGFKLTEEGFEADGYAVDEDGKTEFTYEKWSASRRYET